MVKNATNFSWLRFILQPATMNTLLVLALFVAIAHCFTEQEYQTAFTSWMQAHKKSYTVAEFQGRFNTFKNNMDYVSQWNSKNTETKRMLKHVVVS